MDILKLVELNLFSLLLLAIILFYVKLDDPDDPREKYFMRIMYVTIIALFLEVTSYYVNGLDGMFYFYANHVSNVLLIAISILPVYYYLLYVDFEIHKDKVHLEKYRQMFVPIVYFNAILAILSPFTEILYTIDDANVFSRTGFYFVFPIIIFSMIVTIFFKLFHNNDLLDRHQTVPMALFILPAILGGVVQTLFFGVLILWSSVSMSILVLFLFMQQTGQHKDYVTNLVSRKRIREEVRSRIIADQKFQAISLNIDNFKYIHDTFGHNELEKTLVQVTKLINETCKPEGIVSRYTGSTYVIVTNRFETDYIKELQEKLQTYNASKEAEYEINFTLEKIVCEQPATVEINSLFKEIII